ncbi:MAG TPA: cobalt-precorrin-6A reductase [Beijerinckia sp.]|nr:cobalt-precorrin-6A reductase [Beijerinckia sp.]
MRVLVLGGTSEASALARLLAERRDVETMLSLAGRTKAPALPPIPFRIGGFGGVDGLAAYLAAEAIDVLVDATHPFAEQMSRNAELAAERARIPLIVLTRPEWTPVAGDHWIEAGDMAEAACAIGDAPKRVLLTIGRLQLKAFEAAPQHFYLIRTIDAIDPPPALPRYCVMMGRGPFELAQEETLMREEKIDVLVTKNSGGTATFAKILAARQLGLPVIMVGRPKIAHARVLSDPGEVLATIDRHGERLAERGV